MILDIACCRQFADAVLVAYQQLHDSKPNRVGQGPQAFAGLLQLLNP